MENNNELIKLPARLALTVNEILKEKIDFKPRVDSTGGMSFNYTNEELSLVTKLNFDAPVPGCLNGIELLPNLQSLTINSNSLSYYTQNKNIYSISDNDGISISKCKNLDVLEIVNQTELTYLDVSNLKKLTWLNISNNTLLEELEGLDSLSNLWQLDLYGNELLTHIDGINNIINNNENLAALNLDVLLFPDAIGYNYGSELDPAMLKKFIQLNASWIESLRTYNFRYSIPKISCSNIPINTYQMVAMHEKAYGALEKYVPRNADKRMIVLGIEQYLSENVQYDDDSKKTKQTHTYASNISAGPKGGANGAYNAFIFNTCVCEGYTRAMQYLLKLKNIKSHDVNCIATTDTIHLSSSDVDDRYRTISLPVEGYHSIICIDDMNYLYDDPCINATHYRSGDKSFPYTLLTKDEISRTHTLSFNEKIISNEAFSVPREEIKASIYRNNLYREMQEQYSNTEEEEIRRAR